MKRWRHDQANSKSKLENLEPERNLHRSELEQVRTRFNTTMAENSSLQSKHDSLWNESELVRTQQDADCVKFEALRTQFRHVVSQKESTNEESTLQTAQHNNVQKELVSVVASFENLEAERDVLTHRARRDILEVDACRRERDNAKADLARAVDERNRGKVSEMCLKQKTDWLFNRINIPKTHKDA